MVTATLDEFKRAGIRQLPEAVAADAGYWNEQQMDEVVANKHIPVLVAPDEGSRATPKRWLNGGRATWMRTVLASEHGRERYGKRKQTVEPLYGDTKHNKGFIRFHRRGRMKVRTELRWRRERHGDDQPHSEQQHGNSSAPGQLANESRIAPSMKRGYRFPGGMPMG